MATTSDKGLSYQQSLLAKAFVNTGRHGHLKKRTLAQHVGMVMTP